MDDDKKAAIKEIATYAITLVAALMGIKAEHDDNNLPLDRDRPRVMPQQLLRLRPANFIQDVLEPYRDHLDSFWAPERIEEIEADHRCFLKMYRDD